MDLELKIKNFGPIDEATIQVGQFTVFAGPNNTGKTFVAKMLYSMLGARKANHALVFFDMMVHSIELNLQSFEQIGRVVEERPLSAIRKRVQKIDSILRETFPSNPTQSELDRLRAVQSELMTEIEKIKVHCQTLKNSEEKEGPSSATHQLENFISTLEHGFKNVEWMINWGRSQKLHQNIRGNFQEWDLSNIKGDGDSPLYFSIEGVGELRGTEKSFAFNLYPQIVQKMQSFPEAFYLESPLYWKLKSALESIKLDSRSPFTALNGVPDYFYDMAVALRRRRIEHPFAEIHTSLYNAISGQILLSEAGDLEFQQKGKSIPLSLTSAGVTNMGMLALLIERGALEPIRKLLSS